jgi:hypothetical protein
VTHHPAYASEAARRGESPVELISVAVTTGVSAILRPED